MTRFAVIGLGTFGMGLAHSLARLGGEVVAVDNEMEHVELIRDAVHTAVRMDASDREALKDQCIHEVGTAVVCMGEDFEAAELCAVHLLELGCPRVIVRGTSRERVEILRALGPEVIAPGNHAARELAVRILSPGLVGFSSLDGPHDVAVAEVPKRMEGTTLEELDLWEKCRVKVMALRRVKAEVAEILTGVSASTALLPGDRLYLIGTERDLVRAGRFFA